MRTIYSRLGAMVLSFVSAWTGSVHADGNLVGVGVRHGPDYDGASHSAIDMIPILTVSHGAWFGRSTQGLLEGGLRFTSAGGVSAGLQVAHEAGPRGRNDGASIGAGLEWKTRLGPAPLQLVARWRQQLESERGAAADLRATAGLFADARTRVGVFVQTTWADTDYRHAHYDVSGSGFNNGSIGAFASFDLGHDIVAIGSAEVRRLDGSLDESRWVDAQTHTTISLGVAYRF